MWICITVSFYSQTWLSSLFSEFFFQHAQLSFQNNSHLWNYHLVSPWFSSWFPAPTCLMTLQSSHATKQKTSGPFEMFSLPTRHHGSTCCLNIFSLLLFLHFAAFLRFSVFLASFSSLFPCFPYTHVQRLPLCLIQHANLNLLLFWLNALLF